ncbi:MAG: hypothetical protein ACRDA4_08105 [Filifactoraceae bacterium]
MKKNNFLVLFKNAIETKDIEYIAVKVIQPSGKFEVISFTRDLFEDKYNYYNNAYDDDMKLKSFNKIYITHIGMSNNIAELSGGMFKTGDVN